MMKLFLAYLPSDVKAFNFKESDFEKLKKYFSNSKEFKLVYAKSHTEYLDLLPKAHHLAIWNFKEKHYSNAPLLEKIWTPAAGQDWIAKSPTENIPIHHCSFHGEMMRETFLGFLLYFQNQFRQAILKQKNKEWDRNFQRNRKLLSTQSLLILGAGNIAQHCALSASSIGLKVDFLRNSPKQSNEFSWETVEFDRYDHILNLLPGTNNSELINKAVMDSFKRGVFFYNLGRGNTVDETELYSALNSGHIAGAGLDVTYEEPLQNSSKIWDLENVLITPHSSCIYEDYTRLFVNEIIDSLETITIS